MKNQLIDFSLNDVVENGVIERRDNLTVVWLLGKNHRDKRVAGQFDQSKPDFYIFEEAYRYYKQADDSET